MTKTTTIDFTYLLWVLVILKAFGVLHFSWLWLIIPLGVLYGLALIMALLGVLMTALAFKYGKVKVTFK